MKFIIALLVFFSSLSALAVTIEFPEEELARESVLPLFDNATAVKARLVPTEDRFELGLDMGFAMNEPFFEALRFGGHLAYHFTETHAVNFMAHFYQQGLNANGEAIYRPNPPVGSPLLIRMEFAPQNQWHAIVNYQITPYYGKISVTKGFIMNLSLFGNIGLGMIDIGGETTPVVNLGIGQKFYFGKNWGLRADLGMLIYEGVNYFRAADGSASPLEAVTADVAPNEFERTFNYDVLLTVSAIFLL